MSGKQKVVRFEDAQATPEPPYDSPDLPEKLEYTKENYNGKTKIYGCGHPQDRQKLPAGYDPGLPIEKIIEHQCRACEKAPLEARMRSNNGWLVAHIVIFYKNEDKAGIALNEAQRAIKKDEEFEDAGLNAREFAKFCREEAARLNKRNLSLMKKYRRAQAKLIAPYQDRWPDRITFGYHLQVDWPIYGDEPQLLQVAFSRMLHRPERGVSPEGKDVRRVEQGKKPKLEGDGKLEELSEEQKAENDAKMKAWMDKSSSGPFRAPEERMWVPRG